jgi:Heterokaryon incompatibility protein (HET)
MRDRYARIDPERFSVGGPDIPGHLDPHAEYDQDITDLTFNPPESWSLQSCILCKCIGDALQGHIENGSEAKIATWRPFPFSGFPWLGIQAENRLTKQQSLTQPCVLPICIYQNSATNQTATYETLFLELVFSYEQYGYGLMQVSRLDRSFIDLDSIAKWLARCKNNHGDACNKPLMPTSLPPAFRLIDTYSRRLVEYRAPTQYAALSYTWALATASPDQQVQLERQNLEELKRDNALTASQLSEVIADAIQLCADIGQQYLWVDRLCVMQDDSASKHDQIAAMGTIYQMADFTIVALTNGVGDGLPGVSSRPREPTLENSWRLIATTGGRYSFGALDPSLSYAINPPHGTAEPGRIKSVSLAEGVYSSASDISTPAAAIRVALSSSRTSQIL